MSPRNAVVDAPPDRALDLAGLGAAPQPQVNLLPPEVNNRRALGRTKVRLAAALGLVVVLLVGGWLYSGIRANAAADTLAANQAEVNSLVEAQQQYAEVPTVQAQIQRAETARKLGTSTEVLYAEYLKAIQAVTPATFFIENLDTTMPTPIMAAAEPANVLLAPGIGSLMIIGHTSSLPDVAAWQESLDSIPGFSDSFVTTEQATDGQGAVFYQVSATVQVDATAFANRFAEKAAADVSGDTESGNS